MKRLRVTRYPDDPAADLNDRLRGIPQREIGAALGISQSAVSMKMTGHRRWSLHEYAALMEYLDQLDADNAPESPVASGQDVPLFGPGAEST